MGMGHGHANEIISFSTTCLHRRVCDDFWRIRRLSRSSRDRNDFNNFGHLLPLPRPQVK